MYDLATAEQNYDPRQRRKFYQQPCHSTTVGNKNHIQLSIQNNKTRRIREFSLRGKKCRSEKDPKFIFIRAPMKKFYVNFAQHSGD